jgi:hypothetical protein
LAHEKISDPQDVGIAKLLQTVTRPAPTVPNRSGDRQPGTPTR